MDVITDDDDDDDISAEQMQTLKIINRKLIKCDICILCLLIYNCDSVLTRSIEYNNV